MYSVTWSYRGYGLSTGSASETGIKIDAQCVLRYLRDHPQLKSTSLVLYGRSLGGAIAIYTATLPQAAGFVRGVVLENTFLSITKLIPHVAPIFRPLVFLVNQRWQSEATIRNVDPAIPFLFLSGAEDELVPPAHVKELYELAPATTKILKSLPQGMHNNTCLQEGYWEYLYEFVLTFVEPRETEVAADQEELNDDDYEVLLHLAQAQHDKELALGASMVTDVEGELLPLKKD